MVEYPIRRALNTLTKLRWVLVWVVIGFIGGCASGPKASTEVDKAYQLAVDEGFAGSKNQWMVMRTCPYTAQIMAFLAQTPPPELVIVDNRNCVLSDQRGGVSLPKTGTP